MSEPAAAAATVKCTYCQHNKGPLEVMNLAGNMACRDVKACTRRQIIQDAVREAYKALAATILEITDEDSGVVYTPWIGPNQEMGYKYTAPDGAVRYIYLNPSGGSDRGTPNVFAYEGPDGRANGTEDSPLCHFDLDEKVDRD